MKEVFLWDDHAVIVLTLNNTQDAVTFEEIREFEQLSEETQEPLPDESESGSCNIEFGSPYSRLKERLVWGIVNGRLCLKGKQIYLSN